MTLVHTKTRFEKSHLDSAAACCGGACSTELRSCVAGGVHTHGSLAAWPVAACERGSSTSFARKRAGEAQKHCAQAAISYPPPATTGCLNKENPWSSCSLFTRLYVSELRNRFRSEHKRLETVVRI